jgi:hypothetical protein
MCPHCGQNASLVYRGVSAFCSACGKPRTPFTANAVNLKGKPAKIGGTVAAVAGWIILFGSVAVALVLGSILQAIFPVGAVVGWVIGGLIATVGIAVSLLLLFGGRALRRSGTSAGEAARLDALGTLAAYHHGIITSQNAAEALGVPVEQADAFLTALAKQPDSGITLEFDDEGRITYRFARYAPQPAWQARVGEPQRTALGGEPQRTAFGQPGTPPAVAPVAVDAIAVEAKVRVEANGRPGQTVVPRGGTEVMPVGQPTGPAGTMVVKSRPPQGVRLAEPDEVLADAGEDAVDPRRARS